jgi:soluble lytic murein transglycosylase-like protein
MLKIRALVFSQILIIAMSVIGSFRLAQITRRPSHRLPQLNIKTQMRQLSELLPRPASTKGNVDSRDFIFSTFARELPFIYKDRAELIAYTLISESNKYNLDPLFVLAVIETESHFNPRAHGKRGDIGLMQILPDTSEWMAHRLKMKGRVDLRDPLMNIKIGTAYLAHLRKHFGPVGSRYLAAYNMGIHNVHKLLAREKEPILYANRVLKNYRDLYQRLGVLIPAETEIVASN